MKASVDIDADLTSGWSVYERFVGILVDIFGVEDKAAKAK